MNLNSEEDSNIMAGKLHDAIVIGAGKPGVFAGVGGGPGGKGAGEFG